MDPSNVKLNGIVSEVTDVMTTTGSSLKLAKMLRAEKRKQQAKMHQKKFFRQILYKKKFEQLWKVDQKTKIVCFF